MSVTASAVVLGGLFAAPAGAAVRPEVIAHRGYTGTGCTENTSCAFRSAFTHAADAVEMDVRFTRTAYPVIMHDATVTRTTTGSGKVSAKTVGQFTALHTNDGGHPPTLAQALSAVRSKGGRALVELKTAPSKTQMAHFDAKIAESRLPKSRVIVQSFSSAAVWTARRYGWRAIRLLTYATTASWTWNYTGIAVPYAHITAGGVAKEHAHGVLVYAYTVDTPSAWPALARAHVDAIISDKNPAAVKAAI
ncbi:MAG TPA: glycerophosphodiester phosphodiesterase [Streptosporangiaceae bacterium]